MKIPALPVLLLFGLTISFKAWAQQPPPERTFEDMLKALPAEEVKKVTNHSGKKEDKEQKKQAGKTLNDILTANESGKKCTLQFVKAHKENMISPPGMGRIENAPRSSFVQVNGLKCYVSVHADFQGDQMMAKADKLRDGQKIFVSGTIRTAALFPDMPMVGFGAHAIQKSNMLVLHITFEADDMGPQKK